MKKEIISHELVKTIRQMSVKIPSFLDLAFIEQMLNLLSVETFSGVRLGKVQIERWMIEFLMQWGIYFKEWVYWQPLKQAGYYGGEFYRLGMKSLPESSLLYQLNHYSQSYQHDEMSLGRYDGYMLPNQWQASYYVSYGVFLLQYLVTMLPSLAKDDCFWQRKANISYIQRQIEQDNQLAKRLYLGQEYALFEQLLSDFSTEEQVYLVDEASKQVKERYRLAFLTTAMTFFHKLNQCPLDFAGHVYVFFDLQQEQSTPWLEALFLAIGRRHTQVHYHLLWQVDMINKELSLSILSLVLRLYQRLAIAMHVELNAKLWQQYFDGGLGYDCIKPKAVVSKSIELFGLYQRQEIRSMAQFKQVLIAAVEQLLVDVPIVSGQLLLGLEQLMELAYAAADEQIDDQYYAVMEQVIEVVWQTIERLGYAQVVQLGNYGKQQLFSKNMAPDVHYLCKQVRLSWQEQLASQALAYRQLSGYRLAYVVVAYSFSDEQVLKLFKQASLLGFDAIELRYFGYNL